MVTRDCFDFITSFIIESCAKQYCDNNKKYIIKIKDCRMDLVLKISIVTVYYLECKIHIVLLSFIANRIQYK
ncbi:MAG: hypothetical protein A2Y03_08275 [Omnitrophica WOR_2 bacterium GWF2_38_59]|nr:MAG: hypothetical protein A2Y06_01445 [Omnitrophica WOR_2 bacterium GWA2_37_7]OGX25488.1 MAG: hypothetical protein A2Y03_08275 [Omnitrophica WOR_2 bacterium GWF2_38_59]OGX48120.1 MAG: hypothetical protein A2243_02900 [Omnitrophica WOR_2 bacterium RIFOXYA2_FULL_38_17]OGX54729.1 MAG: hypothetical protein A2267_08450 [Omnitrophica WOR_2 bacterium RIFOXYA12_FULL_38_10]OGX56400.1 MAG: hypothetical protein A2447_10385 [Omnitrophica WOR_2 bacterium RIFOXYC2_FULL_38_12]OGX58456.1 MAG: hypothetical 